MKRPRLFLLFILCLAVNIFRASSGEAQVSSPDPKYASYNQFFSFDLKVATDYGSNKKRLTLESKIVESTMHPAEIATPSAPLPSIKKFYNKLELYYDGKSTPSLVMDLMPLGFEHGLNIPGPPISDGYISDTLEIKFSRADLETFRKLKPTDAHVIVYDVDGKVVTSADVTIIAEQ